MKIDDSKKIYDSIQIPDELNEVVKNAIASRSKKTVIMKRRRDIMKKTFQGFSVTAAGLIVCTVVALNTSQTFATEMAKLPVIGNIAKVLTVRSYHNSNELYNIDMDVPNVVVENNGNDTDSNLTKEVNAEIDKIVDDYKSQAEAEFVEYKKAFFETGGTEEEWNGRTMDIHIAYDIKSQTENTLSLELVTSKAWVSADEERHYYNLDLGSDKEMTLEDILGKDYITLCNESILKQIKERMAEDENNFYFGFGEDDSDIEGFKTITDDTAFYINKSGNPVIVFPKYEIAPGYMGYQEFEISK
ncbi:RsiV family protein [Lachnospiraceae bacterium NSJ-143]|nr:RsiV family protein [Lachnospiraceae bacterium NSJ-143]